MHQAGPRKRCSAASGASRAPCRTGASTRQRFPGAGIDYHSGTLERFPDEPTPARPKCSTFPDIDPVAIAIGPVAIRWYGLTYVAGIGLGWWLGRRRAARDPWRGWTPEHVDDLVFFFALGAVLGGRIGYVLFYDFLASSPIP